MGNKFFTIMGFLCFIFFEMAAQVLADEIILFNGNILTGTIENMDEGTLILKTDYSQPIEIIVAKIKEIKTDKPVNLYLKEEEILQGRITALEDGRIVVRRSDDQTVAKLEIARVVGMVKPPKVPSKWKGNIAIGADQQTGNTERKGASLGGEAIWRGKTNRFTGRLQWNYAEDEDDISARDTYGLLKHDHFFTKSLYSYTCIEGYNDKFKNWRVRYVIGPGVGWQFWDDKVKFLLLEGGLAYSYEDRYVGNNDDFLSARFALDFRYTLRKNLTFGDQFVIYPKLDQGGEYTHRNESYVLSHIWAQWNLKLSNIWDRNSDPSSGIEKDDFQWILAIHRTF